MRFDMEHMQHKICKETNQQQRRGKRKRHAFGQSGKKRNNRQEIQNKDECINESMTVHKTQKTAECSAAGCYFSTNYKIL